MKNMNIAFVIEHRFFIVEQSNLLLTLVAWAENELAFHEKWRFFKIGQNFYVGYPLGYPKHLGTFANSQNSIFGIKKTAG